MVSHPELGSDPPIGSDWTGNRGVTWSLPMNPKSKVIQLPLREVIPSMIFQNRYKAIFQLVKAPFGNLQLFYL